MLYNPKWKKPATTKSKPSLARLVAWLEKQNPATEYPWGNCDGGCLIHQYLISEGLTDRAEWDEHYFKVQGWSEQGKRANPPAGIGIAYGTPRTFGGALARARRVQDLT